MLAVAEVVVADVDRGLLGHDPAVLADDRPLQGRLLPVRAHDLFQVVVVENAAHHVLGPGLLAALDEHHLQPGLGHRDRGRGTGRAGADHDRVARTLPAEVHLFGHWFTIVSGAGSQADVDQDQIPLANRRAHLRRRDVVGIGGVSIHRNDELRKSSLVASTINASIDSDEKVAIREGFNSSNSGVDKPLI